MTKPVTIQCDASGKGLGAVLLQEGKPVCYASRALTDTESRYAAIEAEMLAVVFACRKFHQYIYGRSVLSIQTINHYKQSAANRCRRFRCDLCVDTT